MRPKKLEAKAVEDALSRLTNWSMHKDGNAIVRVFKFASFVEAFGFMVKCALHAEKLDHHPEWTNVYSRVDVTLSTHDAGGVTELDFELARLMDKAAV